MASLNINDESQFKKNNIEVTLWKDLNWKQKLSKVSGGIKTVCKVLLLIYFFVCGIDILTIAFKLIGGKDINLLTKTEALSNPLVGLMIGILLTILVQSSSTATAIIVSLVSSGAITIQLAIPLIFGSNIGTSLTNTMVSFTQVGDRDAFERAFAGATIHDIFNLLSVVTLLVVEMVSRAISGSKGLLEYITEEIVNATLTNEKTSSAQPQGLKVIVEPITDKIIRVNKKILECWAANKSQSVTTIIDGYCPSSHDSKECPEVNPSGNNTCCFLFAGSTMSDRSIGLILLFASLLLLIIVLITLVKVLNAVLKGSVQTIVKKYVNSDLPYVPFLTGYVALLVGAVMTIIMQSSSIFTSLLNPLIGMGIVTLERCYPLTLGSNIGTTATAMLAAFTDSTKESIQIALVHLIFNVFGILLFYPIPFMRFPIPLAKKLGRVTAKYRWFAVFYILCFFIIVPMFFFGLSMAGSIAVYTFIILVLIIGVIVLIINIMQKKCPKFLPEIFKTWEFLPSPLRSLKPYDRIIMASCGCCIKKDPDQVQESLPQMVLTPSRRYTGSSVDSGIDHHNRDSNDMFY